MSLELYKESARSLLVGVPREAKGVMAEILKSSIRELAVQQGVPAREPAPGEIEPPPVDQLRRQIERLTSVVEQRIEDESEDKYYLADQLIVLNGATLRIEQFDSPEIAPNLDRLKQHVAQLRTQLVTLILADED